MTFGSEFAAMQRGQVNQVSTGNGKGVELDIVKALAVGAVNGGIEMAFRGGRIGDEGMLMRVATSAGSELASDMMVGMIPMPKTKLMQAVIPATVSGAMYVGITEVLNLDPSPMLMKFITQFASSGVANLAFNQGLI